MVLNVVKKSKVKPFIPSSSMADIAFLLIIFFMVTTTFSQDKTSVNLPDTAVEKVEIPKLGTFITIDKDGNVFIDGKPSRMEDIESTASFYVSQNPAHMFILKGDKETKYRNIDVALELLRKSKATNINLPSGQETVQDIAK
ncbi:MAG: hypothetical protein A2161_09495 [Candidatus Schekmanbacteria bacterium RBG_13_48_7]|uniref:Biopolymer transporter ExbD n=1 Tax=Candidatus Schekmanbacteria bacterium RBG_13_48_7 TaxID=1817878 RepID=A0A1F7RJX4_9BACT|nr:MAG: hypothetical protein A2161_09495 [Candidatus Schekmanbacteria bacterium RBG_13_48_7]